MNKRVFRTAAVTSLHIHLISVLSGLLGTAIAFLLRYLNVLTIERIWLAPMISVLSSFLLGSILTMTAGKKFVRFVEKINNALRRISNGDYDVTLEETPPIQEIREILHNFNTMTQELKNTEILRNDFVQNVSHEFKTPLAAIEGYAALLQQPDLNEEQRQIYTNQIIASTRRLNGLSENILLLSRLEHQDAPLQKETFSLDEQLRESILLLEPIWNKKNISLTVDLEDCSFTGNQELLAQVWQNIFGNAVKFTPSGGAIAVTLYRRKGDVTVVVADNGPGMTEEEKKRAFEKFYQADRSHTSTGNGLGLALAKRIIDLHGGTIEIHSQYGSGSFFTVRIPFCEMEENT